MGVSPFYIDLSSRGDTKIYQMEKKNEEKLEKMIEEATLLQEQIDEYFCMISYI